ncbi:MAG: glycosyltransferase [Chloroflexi bacterium]|nr:glycosyltransferase [Chloroflexota bacterium]
MKLSIIIPAYNEAPTICDVLRRVQATPFEKEIIVVDDGSTDGMRELLAGVREPNVRVLAHERNRGKGAALRTGFAAASGDYVIVQDADLEYDPHDYGALLGPLVAGDADVVYGSRFTGSPRRVLLFWHAVASHTLTLLSNMLSNLNLTDMGTGYKAFRIEVVRRLALRSERFGIEAELTAKIARLGCRVYEVPVSYHGRTYEEGKKLRWTDGPALIAAILRYGLLPGRVSTHAGLDTLSTMDGLRRYNAWLWQHISPYVGRRVLEAGCGTGTITRYLAARERVVAVDVDQHYVSTLQQRYADRPHIKVEWTDLASAQWPALEGEALDTVVCMNVLEHLPDDAHVLARFHQALQPGGRVVLLVPAHQWLYGTLDAAIGHYRRYERDSLRALFERCGFEVEQAHYLNPTGVPGWFLNGRVLRRAAIPGPMAGLYDALFPLLRLAQVLPLPWGLSVLVVARKPAPAPAPALLAMEAG